MKPITLASVALAAAVVCLPTAAQAVDGHQAVTKFSNCAALNKSFKHGVGKPGAHDKTSGKAVTNFTRNAKSYNVNKGRDRDKDGIACEKR